MNGKDLTLAESVIEAYDRHMEGSLPNATRLLTLLAIKAKKELINPARGDSMRVARLEQNLLDFIAIVGEGNEIQDYQKRMVEMINLAMGTQDIGVTVTGRHRYPVGFRALHGYHSQLAILDDVEGMRDAMHDGLMGMCIETDRHDHFNITKPDDNLQNQGKRANHKKKKFFSD